MTADRYFEDVCDNDFEKLAYNWSPISFQFLDLSDDYKTKRDLVCPINFTSGENSDKDVWNTKIVRQRLANADFENLIPTVYYSIAVTCTHYYILYAFYHADDETHPSDLEGCLVIIKRGDDAEIYGMITVAHHDFIPYVVKGERMPKLAPLWQTKFDLVYEKEKRGANVIVKQTKGKHPLYSVGRNVGFVEWIRRRKNEILGTPDDAIMYIPGEVPTVCTKERLHQGKGSIYTPTMTYQLVDILDPKKGFYSKYVDAKKRDDGNDTFTKEGKFHRDSKSLGQANGPWLWAPDKMWFGKGFVGQIWNDPAKVALKLFDVDKKEFSVFYQKKMFEQKNTL